MSINEIICFYSKFVNLIGRIPGVIIMYVARVLEKTVKEFWQSTFVPCMYKFKSMQAIYISYR